MQQTKKPPNLVLRAERLTAFLRRQARRIIPKLYQVSTGFWNFIFNRPLTRITQFARKNPLKIFIVILTLFAVEVWDFWTVPQYQILVNSRQTQEFQQRLKEISPASTKLMEQQREIEKLRKEIERLITLKKSVGGGATSYYSAKTPQGACPVLNLAYPTASGSIIRGFSSYHGGVDFVAGYEPVYASASGIVSTVLYGGWNGGYGRAIFIDLPDTGYQLRYAHLSEVKVRVGQIVQVGQVVGIAGSTGNTGENKAVHLHFETLCNSSKIDPMKYLK